MPPKRLFTMLYAKTARARKPIRLEHYSEVDILTLILNTMTLNFDCTHNTAEKIMTCTWLEGRVDLIEFFKENSLNHLLNEIENNGCF